jgi:glutaminase
MHRPTRSFSIGACLLGLAVALAMPSLGAQSATEIQPAVDAAYAKFRTLKEGKNADYIPALAAIPDSGYFRETFLNPADVGGRSSALTYACSIRAVSPIRRMPLGSGPMNLMSQASSRSNE